MTRTHDSTLHGAAVAVIGAAVAAFLMLWPHFGSAATRTTTVSVVAGKPSEFRFALSKKSVPLGIVQFKVVNRGNLPHDFKICVKGGNANACAGKVTKVLSPGRSAVLAYTFKKKGTYEYLCTVPGHAAAGMKGDLRVT